MEIRQLEYFVAVAEEGSFTRAAARVQISQSGVSAQIRQLERELGADLIDRSTRTAALTPAGRAALGPARAALAGLASVRRAVDETSNCVRGTLRVGMVTGCTIVPFFQALARLYEAHPGLAIGLVEGVSGRLVDDVRAGRLDAALVGVAGGVPEGLEAYTIVSEGLAALVGARHPLAGRAEVPLADLVQHRLVAMPPGTGVRTALDQACAALGLSPDVAVEASAADAIAALAGRGLGAGVVTTSMAQALVDPPAAPHPHGLSAVPIGQVTVPALLALVWAARPNPAMTAFERFVRESFGGTG